MNNWTAPQFDQAQMEIRIEKGEIRLYCTRIGLETIKNICDSLLKGSDKEHYHLDDSMPSPDFLTKNSLHGQIVLYESDE